MSSCICRRAVPCFVVCCMCDRTINYRNLLLDMRDFAPLFLDNLCIFCACFCTVMACTVAPIRKYHFDLHLHHYCQRYITPNMAQKTMKKTISKRQSPHFHENAYISRKHCFFSLIFAFLSSISPMIYTFVSMGIKVPTK